MAKIDFSNLDQTQRYEVGHIGNFDLTLFSEDLEDGKVLTVSDFQELVKKYGTSGNFLPKPYLSLSSVKYPAKPNEFGTSFVSEGLPANKPNDKLRKVEFFIDFGATNDDAGNNPHIFKNLKHWMCAEEWRVKATDEKPFHIRIGHTIKGNEPIDPNGDKNKTKVNIYFREDYLFADAATSKLHVTYKLFAIKSNFTGSSGTSYPVSKDPDYQDVKPVLDYATGYQNEQCEITLYEAERIGVELKGLSSTDFLEYNQLEFVYLPSMDGKPSMLYSTTSPILKGSLPIPNFVELDFSSQHLKKNPSFLGSDEEWLKSLVYRFEIKPENVSKHEDLDLGVNQGLTYIALDDVPDLVYSRIFPNSGTIECKVKYGYNGELGNVSSASSPLKTKLKGRDALINIQAPTPSKDLFNVDLTMMQSSQSVSKYPIFALKVTSVYDDLNFGNYIEHARDYLVYGKDYIEDVEEIYKEHVAVNLHVYKTEQDAQNGSNAFFYSKSITIEELSNHMKMKSPILLEYKDGDGVTANTKYWAKADISFDTAPILKELMLINTDLIKKDLTEFITAPNVITNPYPTFDNNGTGELAVAVTHEKMSYYGEVRGQEFFNKINYTGTFKSGKEYKFGDEIKIKDREYAFYQDTTPSVLTDENDPKLRKYKDLKDVAKLPDMKAVFKAMGLSNDNVFNYGLLPYGVSKENVNYPDMETTLDTSKTTWIKTMSKENKLLYISKGSYIDSAYQIAFLRRGLFSSGRTYRFGNHLYKLRFLSDKTSSSLDSNNTKVDRLAENEFLLYDHLLRGTLANYTPGEIGIETTNEHKDWGNKGYDLQYPILNSLPEQQPDINFTTYFEGEGANKELEPYKKIVIKGKAELDKFTVKVTSSSEFISTTSLKYDDVKREITGEFYNLPHQGMNEWQEIKVVLEEKTPTDPDNPLVVSITIYVAIKDAISAIQKEYEILGQNANRIFNPDYVAHEQRFRAIPHEFIAYKNEKNKYGGFAQIVLNAPIVLEEVLPGYEPYNKSIITPGNPDITYMEEYDVGYYGEVEGKELFRPSEIKEFLGLKGLKLINDDDIHYFKTYYHGMICYIPNRTIGKIRVRDLIEKGLVFGFDSDISLNLKGKKYKVMTFNTSECYDHHKGKEANFTLEETEVGGMFKDLICRLTTKYDKMVPDVEKFTKSSIDLNILETDRILTKDMVGEHLTENNNNVLVGDTIEQVGLDDEVDFFPIIFIEATDYSLDLTYPEGGYGKYVVRKVTKTVTETYFEKIQVEKLRRVEKIRQSKTYESKTNIVQVPNGVMTIPEVAKKTDQNYGLIGYWCNKFDLANIADPIYVKSMLDIKNQGGEQKILYSNYMKRFQDYLTKQYIVDGLNGKNVSVALPYHMHVLFDTFLDGVAYIKGLTKEERFIRVTNEQYDNVNNIQCGDMMFPSALAGNVTSSELVYTINGNYQPNNPAVNKQYHIDVEDNIVISDLANDKLQSSWCSLKDKNDLKIQLPYLTPFVPYIELSQAGKAISDNFIEFLQQKNQITQEKVNPNDYCFGYAVANLDKLAYASGGSIIDGSIYLPNFKNDIKMLNYFTSRSHGSDFVDIFEKVEGTVSKIESVMVPIIREEKYIEFETYTAMIDVKRTKQKTITIEEVVYS